MKVPKIRTVKAVLQERKLAQKAAQKAHEQEKLQQLYKKTAQSALSGMFKYDLKVGQFDTFNLKSFNSINTNAENSVWAPWNSFAK